MLSTLLSPDGHSLGHLRGDQTPWPLPYCNKAVNNEYVKETEIYPIAGIVD